MLRSHAWLASLLLALTPATLFAQAYGEPDKASAGDPAIQSFLRLQTTAIEGKFQDELKSLESWQAKRAQYLEEYYYMLGLSPRPEKTPLEAKITGTLTGEGYVVDNLHYQSRPGLYVTANLYRPAKVAAGEKLPAIFYVCGHSGRGRDGNKVAFQSHGIWLARHGYICLIVDTLQLGEIAATHHGTYHLERFWWHSRGYTSAGVEAWNGIRGIDYLISRDDVDPKRIGVTGISGGGAATFWIAAADERVAVAIPVSGMADLESYVPNRVINGHCDCMFNYNTYQWPWTRIASLVAPRPMLFVNSDQDPIFPMDANDRIQARMERVYSLYGAGDQFDAVVSIGGHAYRKDIRQAAYRFLNTHLKNDPSPITDSEIDVVTERGMPENYPIPLQKLRVFPTDEDLPRDRLNAEIDQHFVPLGHPAKPDSGNFASWKESLTKQIRAASFRPFPSEIPSATKLNDVDNQTERLESEPSIEFDLRYPNGKPDAKTTDILLVVLNEEEAGTTPKWLQELDASKQTPKKTVVLCEPRGIGGTKWTRLNPPNYVERSHVLLGRTVAEGRIWDTIAAAKYLTTHNLQGTKAPTIHIAGKGPSAILSAYAAIFAPEIASITLHTPPATHMDSSVPPLLNILRVCDIPHSLSLLAPRPLTIHHAPKASFQFTTDVYQSAGTPAALQIQ